MKKRLLWVLTLAVLALFPYQNVNAALVELSRNGWTVYNVSSAYAELDGNQYVTGDKALDGSNSTYWHSDWASETNKKANQWIVFDLGSEKTFKAFNYVSRASAEASNGNIGGYKLYISTGTPTIGSLTSTMTEIKSGTFTYPAQEHLIELDQEYTARYVMLYSTSTYGVNADNTNKYANCAEFKLYENIEGYTTNFGTSTADGKGALSKITFNINGSTQDITTGKSSSAGAIYVDKVSEVVTVEAGAEISSLSVTGTVGNAWMHGYLYVDWNNDKTFTKELNNYVPTENSELIAYGFWTGTDGDASHGNVNDATGYNHKGNQISDSTTPNRATNGALQSFTIPANIPAGDYRARYKVDWNCINPNAVLDLGYGAMVLDFTIRVTTAGEGGGGGESVDQTPQRSAVFTMGESGSQYYRIPALVETANGTLVAIADQRGSALGDLPNIISIVAKTSTDKGKTWGTIKTIAQGVSTSGTTYGDAAAVYDEKTGKIITIFVGNENYGTNCVGLWASSSSYPLRLYKSESSDNGATWTAPVDISESIYNGIYGSRASWIGMFAGSGSAVQLKQGTYAGRLMFVVAARQNSTWGGAMSNYTVYSDDNGATWKVSNAACTSGDEAKVVELADGSLLMSIKNRADDSSNGSGYRLMAKSTNGGATWTSASVNNNLKDPACNGDVISVNYGGKYYLLHSLPASTSTRENVTVYVSEDGGTTWPISRQIYSGYSAYSTLEELNDGTIGIIIEEGKWDQNLPGSDGFNLAYYNFTMSWLLNQEVSSETLNLIKEAKELISKEGVGYPAATARTTFQAAIDAAEANPNAAAATTLQAAINTYITTTDITKPEAGKSYVFIGKGFTTASDKYLDYENGQLTIKAYTEGTTEIPSTAVFTCEVVDGEYKYMFKTSDGKYMAFPSPGKSWLHNKSESGIEASAGNLTKFDIRKMVKSTRVQKETADMFGEVYFMGFRGNDGSATGTATYGSIIIKNGAFDAAGEPYSDSTPQSSAFMIVEVESPISDATIQLVADAKEILKQTGVGYPADAPRATLQAAIDAAEANPTAATGSALQTAINTYYASTDIIMPEEGKVYAFVSHTSNNSNHYIYNNQAATPILSVATYTESTEIPANAKFVCSIVDGKYLFQSQVDNKYMAYPTIGGKSWLDNESETGLETSIAEVSKFEIGKLTGVTATAQELFGYVHLWGYRGYDNTKRVDARGPIIVKEGAFDGAAGDYYDTTTTSAFRIIEVKCSVTATAEPAEGASQAPTVAPTEVEPGGSAIFTAYPANEGYRFAGWYNGNDQVSESLEYTAENITTALNLVAKYVQQATVQVTIPSEFGTIKVGEEVVDGSISGNLGEIVQLTAVADEGYIFDRWVVTNTSDVQYDKIRLRKDNPIQIELGTYEVEAFFAPEAYDEICKPIPTNFTNSGNVFTVKSASITNGEGVENGDIVGTAYNMKNTTEVQGNISHELAQWGATKAITVEPGATFTLNIEYSVNWNSVQLFINENGAFSSLYGPYTAAGQSAGEALTAMRNDTKINVSENIASFPITISDNHRNGDIVVIRTASGAFNGNACPTSLLPEGAYLDFVFVVEGYVPSRTINVNVEPANSAIILMNEESDTSLTTEGAIEITVQPKTGYVFENWTDKDGNVISSEPTLIDKTEGDKTYTANLVKTYTVTTTVKAGNENCGTVRVEGGLGEGVFKNATTATLVAEPKTGYKFIQWTLNGKTISTEAIYETVIMKDENYIAEFEKTYIEMSMYYALAQDKVAFEERANRYLASVTAVAGKETEKELTTVVFDTQEEIGLHRVDAESTAYARTLDGEAVPTTTGALIDETGNTIKVLVGTTTLDLNFKAWLDPMTVSGYIAQPELNETQQAIYVDWNNDRDFMDDGENYNKVDNTYPNPDYISDEGYNRQITIPEDVQPGLYRMRVVYYDPTALQASLDWTQALVDETLEAGERVINQGRAYDFAIRVLEDRNYITFDAPGGSFFHIEDNAEITLTYPDEEATIYYTIDGTDPNSYDPTLKSGGTIALNTYVSGEIDIKARVGENGTIYSAKYYVASASSNVDAPTITSDANASTIIAAEIKNGTGIENGPIDYQFSRGQKVVLDAIPITSTPDFTFDITYEMSNYGLTIWRLDVLDDGSVKSSPLLTSNTTGAVDMAEYETFLTNEGKTYKRDGNNITLSFNIYDLYPLNEGNSIIIRAIASNKQTQPASGETIDVTYYDTYGVGEYVDFVFTVTPKEEKIKLYGTEGKNIAVSVTTTEDCFLAVGGTTKNMTAGETVPVEAKMNAAGEIAIEAVGGNISGIEIEMLECGTNILLPETDLVKSVKLKSDVDFKATTVSYASVLPQEGVLVEVEKEIMLPYDKDGNGTKPAYYNFLSMPFDFDAGINIEYYDQSTGTWKPAVLEQDIRILLYNSATRACGTQYYGKNWQKLSGTGGIIFANKGFVMVGNVKHDNGDHKMKVRFKSFYAEQAQPGQQTVTREIKYEQDGNPKSVRAINYRSTIGETHPFDDDWQHVGSPYLTHSDGIDYILYYHDGYKYIPVSQIEAPTIAAFQSVMFQANLGDIAEQNIVITPLAASSRTKMAQSVYGRAYLAINDEESVKIMLSDEASENFVVNEDAWYLEPTSDNEATMSVKVSGSEASITVQPEPTEMPLTVYTGVKSTQTISLSRVDGDVNIYLKDAVTDEVVCLNDEDYTFEASPKTTIANRFTISMTEPTGIEDNTISTSDIKVVVNGDNLTIYGTEAGETVTLYTINGTVLATAEAEDGVTTIETTATGVVVVKVGTEAVKVVK